MEQPGQALHPTPPHPREAGLRPGPWLWGSEVPSRNGGPVDAPASYQAHEFTRSALMCAASEHEDPPP